jgi:predicted nuclease of predicted toxin-antitoxin system
MNSTGLRFLADESCDFAVVRVLRAEGHDVVALSEVTRRSDDREVIERAAREQRILLTEDKDFGWLVFVSHADSAGAILIRFPGDARQTLARAVGRLVREQAERLRGAFVVVQPGHVRISREPIGSETGHDW